MGIDGVVMRKGMGEEGEWDGWFNGMMKGKGGWVNVGNRNVCSNIIGEIYLNYNVWLFCYGYIKGV